MSLKSLRVAIYDQLSHISGLKVYYSLAPKKQNMPYLTYNFATLDGGTWSGNNADVIMTVNIFTGNSITEVENMVQSVIQSLDNFAVDEIDLKSNIFLKKAGGMPFQSEDLIWQSTILYSFKVWKT
jgi:hypothetical protein